MNINKKLEGNNLKITLEGRLDTTHVPELEKEIKDLNEIDSILFDFENVDYISSSGLRLILKCKKEVDSTRIINCKPEVYEVFEMTGFSEMMEIEKAFRSISIDNCKKIGEGFYGDIYRLDSEKIVKVYKIPDSLDMIKREIGLAKKAFVLGIPTAIPYDIVKVGDLYGAVFELINAKMIVNKMENEEYLNDFARKSADILKDMHQKKVEDGILPSRKKTVIGLLNDCKRFFSKECYERLVSLLETIPETNTLLHCDFHIKNILAQNDDLLLIDMETLSTGHPIFEFGPMLATYEGYSCIDKHNTDKFLGINLNTSKKIFDRTLKYYYANKSVGELEDIKQKLSVICYIQILKLRSTFGNDLSNTQSEEIEFCRKYLSDIATKLNTLNY